MSYLVVNMRLPTYYNALFFYLIWKIKVYTFETRAMMIIMIMKWNHADNAIYILF